MRFSIAKGLLCFVIFIYFACIAFATCGGKTLLETMKGRIIVSNTANTLTNLTNIHCEWLIRAPEAQQTITLKFKYFDSKCGFDYLKVYDGLSRKTLLGVFSGNTLPTNLFSNTSGIVIEFFSDYSYVRNCCIIDFVVTNCPNDCSGNGTCHEYQCYCDKLYTGRACEIKQCPNGCNHINAHGECLKDNTCGCQPKFIGQSCSLFVGDDDVTADQWHVLSEHSSIFKNRYSHAGVIVNHDLWIFGGCNLNEFFNDVVKFNFQDNHWTKISWEGGNGPTARAQHSMVSYKDSLVVFGGKLKNGSLSNELWIFNITTKTWSLGNNKNSPPGLASHCSCVSNNQLIIFGGEMENRNFSHQMFSYDLSNDSGWISITYKLFKLSDLRLVGHSCVVYEELKSFIVYGGFRINKEMNHVLFFHLESHVWLNVHISLKSVRPTAYHSSILIGHYLVNYGGILNTCDKDESCYENRISMLNLKNFVWKSFGENYDHGRPGRFSHVAHLLNKKILVVSGGFSGIVRGDLIAYKILSRLISDNQDYSCSVFKHCIHCLTWGSNSHVKCGWCVQDSTCYSRDNPLRACPKTKLPTKGWWGNKALFLKSFDQCRIYDDPPGLMAKIYFEDRLSDVYVINPLLDKDFYTSPRRLKLPPTNGLIKVSWTGFIYPFISTPSFDKDLVLRSHMNSASIRLSRDEQSINAKKVISKKTTNSEEFREKRFPELRKGQNLYYIDVRTEFQKSDDLKNILLKVSWSSDGDADAINGAYVRPFYSTDCMRYSRCLECLSDASCGWCQTSKTCLVRNSSTICRHPNGNIVYLILDSRYCETCIQYTNSDSCKKDSNCAWKLQICEDIVRSNDNQEKCTSSFQSNQDCHPVRNKKCLPCQNYNNRLPWISYPSKFGHNECSNWSHNCLKQTSCSSCLKTFHCGWCGEFHNGSCFAGQYSSPDNGTCEHLLSQLSLSYNEKSFQWSYGKCPDENECITRRDCDKNAVCINTVGSYKCKCKHGFEGNGKFCKAICNPRCHHGYCSKHPSNDSLDVCKCKVGWTGRVCSEDCGCNKHSTCKNGAGLCDSCQDLTYGKHCEFCIPGSYGNATSNVGCTLCQCNGHGDVQKKICNDRNGHCYCIHNTMGRHCDQCQPGFYGQPKRESCYSPCKSDALLTNITNGLLRSVLQPLHNQSQHNDEQRTVKCLWAITTLTNTSRDFVYTNGEAPGSISLVVNDISLDCHTSHLYIYDISPSVKNTTRIVGSLCGTNPSSIRAIESRSGTMIVIFKGKVAQGRGFNVSFVVNYCPTHCTGNRFCRSNGLFEECVCKSGFTGPNCADVMCGENCGHENATYKIPKRCVCKAGHACNMNNSSNDWMILLPSNNSSTLARMGHTMIADGDKLIIYGGYSLSNAILGDIWRFSTKTMNYVVEDKSNAKPSPRYFHAAVVHERTMYVTGGVTDKGYTHEVWKYNLDEKKWNLSKNLPRSLAGHTVNAVNSTLYLIGGYSPENGCSTTVYILKLYNLESTWVNLNPLGEKFDGCFGHTTVYDHQTKSLITFGKKAEKMESTLAMLDLIERKWTVLSQVSQISPRLFHLSVIYDGLMFVTSGYTDNGFLDFSEQPLIYDLRCKTWHEPNEPKLFTISLAHGSVTTINDVMFIFGGYNGFSSSELYFKDLSLNLCSMFSTKAHCAQLRPCQWHTDEKNVSGCFLSSSRSFRTCSTIRNTRDVNVDKMPSAISPTSSVDCDASSQNVGCLECTTESSCSWSVDLHRCFSHDYEEITCPFGICGLVLRNKVDCPGPCNVHNYCYDCLKPLNCGWCSNVSSNGVGFCAEGTVLGVRDGSCPSTHEWSSLFCPLENECLNNHNDCGRNETCINEISSFRCECQSGYRRMNGSCVPVCSQGCVKGHCISPNECFCNFGWTGSNCSTACQCYGKGRCHSEQQLDKCDQCVNNTTGDSCEKCVRGYVGEKGHCTSCYELCNYNAQECYTSPGKFMKHEKFGPKSEVNLSCICSGNSQGKLCENCVKGYFKSGKKCVKCECRGHSDTCNFNNGFGCDCENNSTTPSNENFNEQCSLCKSTYHGNPYESQHCYRELSMLSHQSLARDESQTTMLLPFQTSFYVLKYFDKSTYPNFDIRLTFDVVNGSLDVYISNSCDAFTVDSNQRVSMIYKSLPTKETTDGLNIYTEFYNENNNTVITSCNVQHRLIVLFPHDRNFLNSKQFFVVVKAGGKGADGIVYFKQDIIKINLIVFFIVFASCFLFLLMVVSILWSIRNYIHSRQEIHHREIENERRFNRPCSKFSFLFEYQSPTPTTRHRKTTTSTKKAIKPIAVQFTNDHNAAVTTVLFQLPQTEKTKMALCLGTCMNFVSSRQLDRISHNSSS